jgi:hypothetical protein
MGRTEPHLPWTRRAPDAAPEPYGLRLMEGGRPLSDLSAVVSGQRQRWRRRPARHHCPGPTSPSSASTRSGSLNGGVFPHRWYPLCVGSSDAERRTQERRRRVGQGAEGHRQEREDFRVPRRSQGYFYPNRLMQASNPVESFPQAADHAESPLPPWLSPSCRFVVRRADGGMQPLAQLRPPPSPRDIAHRDAMAFFCPTSTTSRLPRVTHRRLRFRSH